MGQKGGSSEISYVSLRRKVSDRIGDSVFV